MTNDNSRRVWTTIQVAPDPHQPMHLYAVQELSGTFVDGPEGRDFEPAQEPLLTRVLYAKMNPNGKLVNVNSGSWEGRE